MSPKKNVQSFLQSSFWNDTMEIDVFFKIKAQLKGELKSN